jgi:hypothetical protein
MHDNDATTQKRIELLTEAFDAAYTVGYHAARNDLLYALKDHECRSAILKALADKSFGENKDE